jgi:hypothetical protein
VIFMVDKVASEYHFLGVFGFSLLTGGTEYFHDLPLKYVPSLNHIHLTSPHEAWDSPDHSANYQTSIFRFGVSFLT